MPKYWELSQASQWWRKFDDVKKNLLEEFVQHIISTNFYEPCLANG